MRCGLLGEKLSHSYSPQIHGMLWNYSYDLFEKSPEELADFLQGDDFDGCNVTIPYKKAVIPYCQLSETAKRLGAVNTLVRQSDGSLKGYNTDYFGFQSMVERSGLQVAGKKALVLGSGGASVTVCAVLQEFGAKVVVVSRTGENNYSNLHLHKDAAIIVNTTPVGMYPNTGISPLSLDEFPKLEGVLDLIYNPARTALLQAAEKRGLVAENGLWMLVAQAKKSAELFTGNQISDDVIGEIHGVLSTQMQNIILIGMPGCGKTTVGSILAERLGRKFVDADAVLAENAGMTIPEIFAKEGEAGFRARETCVLKEICKQSSLVIATGGGCVTRQENYDILRQNGKTVWLRRELDCLPTDGRPLSQANSLTDMYRIRKPLYEAFADISINNHGAPEDAVQQLLKQLQGED